MHQFVESCINNGFSSVKDNNPSTKFFIRSILRRVLIGLYFFIRMLNVKMPKQKALIVTSSGEYIPNSIFPYYFNYEIIPMLWDSWPFTWERMYSSFEKFDIHTVFVTSSQVAEQIKNKTNIKAYWIPEGIDVKLYKNEKK